MGQFDETPRSDRDAIERFLALFTEVRGGEGGTVLLLALNIFLVLTAYYIIKPVREGLILAAPHGAEYKSYASAAQAVILLLVAVPAYTWVSSRVPRRRLLQGVTLFFVAHLVVFYLAVKSLGTGGTVLGVGFYVWVGVFNLMVPALFWSLANDIYTPEQGKRLFAIVAFGASAGAVFGSTITGRLIEPLGVDQLLLVSAAVLLAALAIALTVEGRQRAVPTETADGESKEDEPFRSNSAFDAFGLVLRNRYLLMIALLMLLLNWVNTTGEFILGDTVKDAIERQAAGQGLSGDAMDSYVSRNIGQFYADFFAVVNVVALTVQLFLVSRILKYIGVRGALLVLPVIALGGYTILAFFPVLVAVRWAKTAENSTDYSLQNTVRQALFLPTSREEKYNAKQAIDTFFVRAGDVFSALLVYVGLNVLTWSTQGFALFNLGLVVVWLLLAWRIGRRYHALADAAESATEGS